MSSFWDSKSIIVDSCLSELKGYALLSHQFSEVDIVNVLQQRSFEEVFEHIIEGSDSQLQEYLFVILLQVKK